MFCPKISRKGIKKPPPFDSVGEGTSLVIGDWSLVIGLTTAPSALAYPSYVYQNCVFVVSTRGCYAFPKD